MSPAGEHRVIRAKATGRTMLRDPDAIRDRAVAMYRGRLAGQSASEIGVEFDLTSRHVNRAIAALPEELRRRIRKAAGALEAAETTDRR